MSAPTLYNIKLCKYFYGRRGCHDANCGYTHALPENLRQGACRYEGRPQKCKLGAHCPLSHDVERVKEAAQVCARFQRNDCTRGSSCRFEHVTMAEPPRHGNGRQTRDDEQHRQDQPASSSAQPATANRAPPALHAAQQVILLAAQQDYGNPTLTDVARKTMLKNLLRMCHPDKNVLVPKLSELFEEMTTWATTELNRV